MCIIDACVLRWHTEINAAMETEVVSWLSRGFTMAEIQLEIYPLHAVHQDGKVIVSQKFRVVPKIRDNPGLYQGAGI